MSKEVKRKHLQLYNKHGIFMHLCDNLIVTNNCG